MIKVSSRARFNLTEFEWIMAFSRYAWVENHQFG